MLDNLRDDAYSQPFFEDESQPPEADPGVPPPPRRSNGRLLGMTPIQRFVIAVMLMLVVCLLGTMFLLATGRFGLYF